MSRRTFGTARRRPSGRWQVRYLGPDGLRRPAPITFATKADAMRWLAQAETDISRGAWTDPAAGSTAFRSYAEAWLASRTVRGRPLAPRTVMTYRSMLDRYILPTFGDRQLKALTPVMVRTWHAGVAKHGPTPARQAYALLRAIYSTAVADEAVLKSPCRIPGAGQAVAPERPLFDVNEVENIRSAIPTHLRTFVSVSYWGHLRLGEALGLNYGDIDFDNGCLTILRQQVELGKNGVAMTEPKAASKRTVHLPRHVMEELRQYVAERPGLPNAPLFTRQDGRRLRERHIQYAWKRARTAAGLPHAHFHDLRHSGLTLAAQLGATTAEVMARAGHASSRAALIYQHAATQRDVELAGLLDQVISKRALTS